MLDEIYSRIDEILAEDCLDFVENVLLDFNEFRMDLKLQRFEDNFLRHGQTKGGRLFRVVKIKERR